MTSLHYPSLELCNKLTKSGFPETEKNLYSSFGGDFTTKNTVGMDRNIIIYKYPSVMELLDEIPKDIKGCGATIVKNYSGWYVRFEGEYAPMWMAGDRGQCDSLPNALAEMWLWLKENNYLTK